MSDNDMEAADAFPGKLVKGSRALNPTLCDGGGGSLC